MPKEIQKMVTRIEKYSTPLDRAVQQGEHYLGNFGNLEKRVHFLKVLVKDIWKTGFRSSLSQKLKICRPF